MLERMYYSVKDTRNIKDGGTSTGKHSQCSSLMTLMFESSASRPDKQLKIPTKEILSSLK